jgi:hypothetical protein
MFLLEHVFWFDFVLFVLFQVLLLLAMFVLDHYSLDQIQLQILMIVEDQLQVEMFSQQLFWLFHQTKTKISFSKDKKSLNKHLVEIDVVQFYPIEMFLNQEYKQDHWPIDWFHVNIHLISMYLLMTRKLFWWENEEKKILLLDFHKKMIEQINKVFNIFLLV